MKSETIDYYFNAVTFELKRYTEISSLIMLNLEEVN